jgi:hypothetical protein
MMSHRLFIVPRGHDRLYEDLRQQFAENPEVEVMVDRRDGERQQRRHSDRPGGRSAADSVVSGRARAVPGLPVLIVELPSTAAR